MRSRTVPFSIVGFSFLKQILCLVKDFSWNDRGVRPNRVILFMFTLVLMAGRWKCIAGVGFLPKRVTDVSLICEDVMNATPPPRLILSTEYACLIQSVSDAILAVSIQIPLEYFADGHRLFWNNYNFFIYDPISIRYGRCENL